MKKSIQRPLKDDRDEQIDVRSKYHALDFLIAATQIVTIMCIIKKIQHGKAVYQRYFWAVQPCYFTNMISIMRKPIFMLV